MPIKLNAASGGSVSFDVPSNTSSTFTLTAPARTGTIITSADSGSITSGMIAANAVTQSAIQSGFAGNGPAFSVYRTASVSMTYNNFTKIPFDTKEFDTGSYFDNTTNYRFLPLIAGYYQISVSLVLNMGGASACTMIGCIYKNGSLVAQQYQTNAAIANIYCATVAKLVYLNGSTDYVEGFYFTNLSGATISTGSSGTYMTGYLARSA